MDAGTKSFSTSYCRSVTLLLGSNMLERAVYYGFRGLLILYMVGETFEMPNGEAYTIYGIFTVVIMFTRILGAVIGDLILSNRLVAIIGAVLQALGAFTLCVPSLSALYIGIGLVSLGSGLYGPNLFSQFGKLHLNKEAKMDSGFTLLYLAINLGAFLGILFLGILGEKNFTYGFIAAGILALISVVFLLLTKTNTQETLDNYKKTPISKRLIMVLIAIFISTIFWGVYELGISESFLISYNLRETLSETLPSTLLDSLNSFAIILFGIAAVVIWWLWRLNRFIKLGIGFIAGGLSFAVLLFMPEGGQTPGLIVFIISILLLGLAEILISPTINSVLTKYTNPKYLAIVFSLALIPLSIFYRLNGLMAEYYYDIIDTGFFLKLSTFLLVAAGIAIIISGFIFFKKKPVL